MDPTLEQVSSSLAALTRQYETVTANLANANTTAYKRQMTAFSQELSRQMGQPAQGTEAALSENQVVSTNIVDFTQGALNRTENPLDVAISGNGFFVIQTPQGDRYSRGGSLQLNERGQLVDSMGRMVAGQSGPIIVPPTAGPSSVRIGEDGTVSAGGATLGKLRIVQAPKDRLEPVGNGCYRLMEGAAAAPAKDFKLHQGFRESSNVNVMEELVSMITVTRLYEAGLKTIHSQDERMKSLLQVASS